MGEEMKRPLDEETSGVVCTQVWKNDLWEMKRPLG